LWKNGNILSQMIETSGIYNILHRKWSCDIIYL